MSIEGGTAAQQTSFDEMTDEKFRRTAKMAEWQRPDTSVFDKWLHQALAELYSGVLNEKVPDEMLKLLQESRDRH